MKRILIVGMGAMTMFVAQGAMANADLAKARNCMACHALANKVVGPALKDVATKYAGQPDAEARLAAKVLKGSTGAWGPVPMPANPQVSEADARILAKWVLTLK